MSEPLSCETKQARIERVRREALIAVAPEMVEGVVTDGIVWGPLTRPCPEATSMLVALNPGPEDVMRREYLVGWYLIDADLRVLARGDLTVQHDGHGNFHPVTILHPACVEQDGLAVGMVYLFRDGPLARHTGCVAPVPVRACRVGDTASLDFTTAAFSTNVDVSDLVDA